MTAPRFRPLTAADLELLGEPCARCTFWEASLADLVAPPEQRDGRRIKRTWAEAVTRRWGFCGVAAVQDGDLLGFLTMAPASLVPRLAAFATTPVSPDAAVLLTVQVAEEHRGHGLGRQLVQSAAALLVRRDIRALEAIGSHRLGTSCVLPAGWLESVGFSLARPHPIAPRYRMDLHSGVRWLPDLGAAWVRLTGLVTPPSPTPEPAGYAPYRVPTPR